MSSNPYRSMERLPHLSEKIRESFPRKASEKARFQCNPLHSNHLTRSHTFEKSSASTHVVHFFEAFSCHDLVPGDARSVVKGLIRWRQMI